MGVRLGYKVTDIGAVPEDWDVLQACEIGTFKSGSGFPLVYQGKTVGTYPFFKVSDMNNDGNEIFMTTANNYISEPIRKRLGAHLFPAGTIVFAKVGAAVFLERKRVLVQPSCIDNNMAGFILDKSRADVRFIHSLLLHTKLSALVATTALPSLNGKQLGGIALAIPPLPEQRAIADAFSDVDRLLDGLDWLIDKKRNLKQAVLQQLITGQIRLPGFHDAWETKRLAELADIRSGGTPSTAEPRFWDGDIPWCTPTDITALSGRKYLEETSRKISLYGLKSSSAEMIPAKSIVMTSRATIGECAINTVPVSTNQGFKNFVPLPNVDVDFLYYLLTAQKQGFLSLCSGSTFLEIGKTQLVAYEVRVPVSKAEQTAIAAVLSDMDFELSMLEEQRIKYQNIKQAMMQELLTGRTRLPLGSAA